MDFLDLPKPGETKQIPGGRIWCDSWEVIEQFGRTNVTITFGFEMDPGEYASQTDQPKIKYVKLLENEH